MRATLEGLKGSQLVLGTTRRHGLVATSVPFPTAVTQLPYRKASPPIRKRIKLDGGPLAPRLSEHPALLAPYALFYGVGDGERCAERLSLLTGLGCEHASGWGEFAVEDVEALAPAALGSRAGTRARWPALPTRGRPTSHGAGEHRCFRPSGVLRAAGMNGSRSLLSGNLVANLTHVLPGV